MKTQLGIEGMTCEHCVRHVTDALRDVAGVEAVSVSLEAKAATVEHDAERAPLGALCRAVEQAGYKVRGGE